MTFYQKTDCIVIGIALAMVILLAVLMATT